MRKDRIQFFGIVYRQRYSFSITPPEKAMEFKLNGIARFSFLKTRKPGERYIEETIKVPFQRGVYYKIKVWMETPG